MSSNRLAVVLACVVGGSAGCSGGSGSGSVLPENYAANFAGIWDVTAVVTASGQTESYTGALEITEEGVNLLELPNFCEDGSGPKATVTGPSTFRIGAVKCPPFAATGCAAVSAEIRDGSGSVTGKNLSMHINAIESGCGRSFVLTMDFTGTRPNRPPTVSVTLTPAAPRPADDVTAHVEAVDPDGDPVQISYAWMRNGVLIPGQTAAVLPGGANAAGDVVTVLATASDGSSSSTAQASVTIPPIVLSGSPPVHVDVGQQVSFQITATSPDGAPPSDFVLEYGPAGMAVDPSGLVTWTAALPMFDRSIDVHFGITLSSSPKSRLTGTIRVDDAARELPLYRTGIEIPVWHAGLQVTDLDGDGRAEMLVASSHSGLFELARSGTGYAQRWAYPFSPGDSEAVQAAVARDLDGDGKQEIVFATGDLLVELDGATRREVARYKSNGAFSCRDLKIADVDLDGNLELVCLGGSSTYAYDTSAKVVVFDAKTLTVKWQTAQLADMGGTLAVGNVDKDAALEIVTSGGYVFDGITQANEWAYAGGFGAVVDVGDLDGDGVAEIVGMTSGASIRGFDAVLKSPLWEKTGFNFDALLVADIDKDGKPEILVGDAQWGNVTAYRYDAGTNALVTLWAIDSQNHGVSALGVGDVDGDGANEVVWGSGASSSGADSLVVAGLNPAISVEWTNKDPNQLDGPFVGGRLAHLGGGATRLLFGVGQTNSGYGGMRLVALDPVTGLVQTSAEVGSNWNTRAAVDVADYDQDGVDEVLVATSNLYDGYFAAYDFSANVSEWTSTTLGFSAAGAAVTHADLNGDGFADLAAVTTDGYVYAFDVKHQALIWKSTGLGSNGVDVSAADLDGDGTAEIVALASGRVVVYRKVSGAVGYVEAASRLIPSGSSGVDLVVADCDGDGTPEIYVLASSYSGPATVLRFDSALNPAGSFSAGAAAQSLHVEDLGSGRKNLVLGVGDFWSYLGTRPYLRAVDARSGAEVWRSPVLWGAVPINSVSYVDAKGDGGREIAFGTADGMYLTR